MVEPLQLVRLGRLPAVCVTVASRRWYSEVLGLPHLHYLGKLAFYDCGGVRLLLSEGDGAVTESIPYFRVKDVRVAHVELAARGIAFTHAPNRIDRHDDATKSGWPFSPTTKDARWR